MLKHLFPDYRYLTLEDPDVREFANSDPRFFLKTYDDKVIFDEVQRTPELFSYLQGVVDKSEKTGQYLLSGSQNFLLMQSITQSLAGRVSLAKLLPFSFQEAQKGGIGFADAFEWVFKGGYPRIYDKSIDPSDYYPDYVQTYLERDVKTIAGVRHLTKYETFIRLCANRVGSILDQQSLASECEIDQKTASSWLSALEASYIVFRLPPYYRNFNKRLVKRPKLYFYDTGLASNLLGIKTYEQLINHERRGLLFENAVIVELMKRELALGSQPEFYFWRDSHKREVDLLIENGGMLDKAIEIKSSTTFKSSFFDTLNDFGKWADLSPKKQVVIYAGETNMQTSKGEVKNIFLA